MEIVDFLLARLDDDETAARAATQGKWYWTDPMQFGSKMALVAKCPGGHQMIVPSSRGDVFPSRDDADHIARHDPARVLADVAAKRVIIHNAEFVANHGPAVDDVRALDMTTGALGALGDVLRILALPYVDHPDYREEWRP